MAYEHRGGFSNPSPIPDSEHRPSPWAQRDHGHHRHTSSFHSVPASNIMEPESEDSDVSITDGDYSGFAFPISLPAAPSKSALENLDTVTTHLKELERVEAHNLKKHERLKEKRARKDERIARKRTAQDERIKAIVDARARHDSRIEQRRQRENIAFQRFYEDLDEEETRLQTRLKRLKRGHLVDDSGPNRRVSLTATSPTVPAYSTIPPPAKRQQTSHPNHAEAPSARPSSSTSHQPSYHFHPGPGPSQAHHTSATYQTGPPYHSPSFARSPPMVSHSRVGSAVHDNHLPNGQKASPRIPPPTGPPLQPPTSAPAVLPAPLPPHPISQPAPAPNPSLSRPPGATYDTRPPPPHSSGFATVNQPPSSGFAAVNSLPNATPVPAHVPAAKDEHVKSARASDQTPVRSSSAEEKPSGSGPGGNKRTPSTTHPYQMSEAFANRHHHCERTDSLNRGIWTWYGLQGTKEHPTSAPTEMYLVCNHDGCRRIDWRTVHGLQCHIVKNHEQPKGTIGSLEKALAAYGVPVRDIEEHERQHGPGSGGTMADPKNAKVRTKAKDVADRRDLSERDSPIPVSAPSHLQKHRSHDSDSPRFVHGPVNVGSRKRSHSIDEHVVDSGSEHTPVDTQRLSNVRAVSGFPAINATWQDHSATPSKPPHARDWQASQPVRTDKRGPVTLTSNQTPPINSAPAPFWPSWQAKNDAHLPNLQPPTPPVATNAPLTREPLTVPTTSNVNPGGTAAALRVEQERAQPARETAKVPESTARDNAPARPETNSTPLEQPVHVTQMTGPKVEEEDVTMTNTTEKQPEEPPRIATSPPTPRPTIAEPAPATPRQKENDERGPSRPDEMDHDHQTPVREDQIPPSKNDGQETRSAEMSSRRISSRRSSRQPSTTATPSAKTLSERPKSDDIGHLTGYDVRPDPKADSVDDDSDSITVNVVASSGSAKDREKEPDRTPKPVRSSGRYSRPRRR